MQAEGFGYGRNTMQSLPKQLTVRVTGTLSPLKTAILRWLSKRARTFDDLVAAFGLPATTIRRCLRELQLEGLIQVNTHSDSSRTWRQYATTPGTALRLPLQYEESNDLSKQRHRHRSLSAVEMAPDDV